MPPKMTPKRGTVHPDAPTVRVIKGPTIILSGGTYFDFEAPGESEFTIQDIAHGLAHICRFGGQCDPFYSVAEHSVHVSTIVPPEHALAGLLHDAAEAFCGDMVKPMKMLCPDYVAVEKRVERAILARFGIDELPPTIKAADIQMLATEQRHLMNNRDEWESCEGGEARDMVLPCWSPYEARQRFVARFFDLTAPPVPGISDPAERVHIFSGEHGAFWRARGEGYTVRADMAGIWPRSTATLEIAGAGPEKMLTLVPLLAELAPIPEGD